MKALRFPWRGDYVSGTARSPHDELSFFGGRRIADVESPELTRLLQAAGVEGVSANNPRSANLDLYAKRLAEIHNAAADQAEAAWVALGVEAPGTSAENGASTNAVIRHVHIEKLRSDAGRAAIAAWLK